MPTAPTLAPKGAVSLLSPHTFHRFQIPFQDPLALFSSTPTAHEHSSAPSLRSKHADLCCLPADSISTHLALASTGLTRASWTEGEGPSGRCTEWVGELSAGY